jgi:predicted nucleic acid-binding protein
MIIVCDTSPICYLILIKQIQVLPQLFGQITIPTAVQTELLNETVDPTIKNWIAAPPAWLTIQPVPEILDTLPTALGQGEREAITLAISQQATLLILDDLDARQAALSYKLQITGLLGVLYRGGTQGYLDFYEAIAQLRTTTFRASDTLIQQLLAQYADEVRT